LRFDTMPSRPSLQACQNTVDFAAFLRDVGRKPRGTRLERHSKTGHFMPGNVAWVLRPGVRKRKPRRR
jgi:hypothetical protein